MKHQRGCRPATLTIAIGAMLGLAVVATAQGPGGPGQGRPGFPGAQGGGFGGGRGGGRGGFGGGRQITAATLPVSALDAIVKLSASQKNTITQIHDSFTKSRAAMFTPGQRPDPATMQKMGALMTQTNQSIEGVLTAAQKTKLTAAMKGLQLYRLAGIPLGLYGQLQLAPAQKTSLQQIQQGMAGAGGPPDRNAMRAAREKAAAVLTPTQKTQIEEYLKAHPDEQPRRGGRGGRGGFGGGGGGRGQ